ncbi:MAG: RNA-binding domain-containing protein [Opitutales bacterium]
MTLKIDQILDAIRLGEDSTVEFKEVRFSGDRVTDPKKTDLAREISALANARGGWLVMGVDDKSRKVLGVPLDRMDALDRFIGDLCSDTIKPPLPVDIYRRELPAEGGEMVPVMIVGIEKSPYVHQTSEGFFYRVGSRAKSLSGDFVLRLHQERSLTRIKRFEELPVPRSTIKDLSEPLWRRFVSELEEDPESALLKRDLLAESEDGEKRASVLGILMCSENPRRFFPNAFIQAVRYRGTFQDSKYQVDAKNLSGPLDRQVIEAVSFVRLNQRIAATKNLGRTDFPQFSERAVFEAIVNAVAHRDYSIDHGKIRLFIFDDRLEVYSPGGLVNSMSIESLSLRTATRNERITNLLSECPLPEGYESVRRRSLMERRADGVNIILHESERHSGRRPEYLLIDDAELMLTIFSAKLPNQEESAPNDARE